jgi:uncharacterized protein
MSRGVSVINLPTGVTPPVSSTAGLPVYVGSAPIHMSADKTAKLNTPVLANNLAEATAALGFLDAAGSAGAKKFDFTLCEAMSAHFKVGNVGPIVLINVLDPTAHKTTVASEAHTLGTDGTTTLTQAHPWPASVVVKVATVAKALGTDYTFTVNSSGMGVVARVSTGTIVAGAAITVEYDYLTPSAVDATDVIGAVDAGTQLKTGLELVAEVFPRFRLVPGAILAPGFTTDATVTAVAIAKASSINGHFNAIVLADIPATSAGVDVYSEAAAWKNTNSYTNADMVVCWPMGRLGDTLYHLSTLTAARAMQTDADNDGIPYESPSNKTLPIDSLVLADGTEVILDTVAAASLNAQGIVTALNFIGGWVLWGNRTGAYPGNTDPADAFIPFVRMRAWNRSVLVLSHWQRVDDPMNRRKLESVVDSENIRLNALAGRGFLLGARVELRAELNPVTDLLDGQVTYSVSWMPPPPMEGITFNVEVDPSYLSTLFA